MKRSTTSATGNSSTSSIIPLNPWAENWNVGLYLSISGSVSDTTVQVTSDDLRNGAPTNWWSVPNWSALNAVKVGQLEFPATAVRISQATGAGTTTLTVIESP